MTAPDQLVWVAAVRRDTTYHHIDPHGLATLCGRSMRHGQSISRLRAEHELAGEECPRCTAADAGHGPADGAAQSQGTCGPAAAPAPPPAAATATDGGVTPVNDRLYEELLRPVVERFYDTARYLAWLPVTAMSRLDRAFKLGRLDALEQTGNLIAEAILVAPPDWGAMRDLALASTPDGAAATSPAAAPPHTPARVAVTTSDSGCPGGHHNLPGAAT